LSFRFADSYVSSPSQIVSCLVIASSAPTSGLATSDALSVSLADRSSLPPRAFSSLRERGPGSISSRPSVIELTRVDRQSTLQHRTHVLEYRTASRKETKEQQYVSGARDKRVIPAGRDLSQQAKTSNGILTRCNVLTRTYAQHHRANPVGNNKADTVLTRAVLKGNRTSQAQSPLCIAQWCLVPSESYQPSNLGDAHNDWQVVGDFRPLVGRGRAAGESMDQERRSG